LGALAPCVDGLQISQIGLKLKTKLKDKAVLSGVSGKTTYLCFVKGKEETDQVEDTASLLTVRGAASQLHCSEAHVRRIIDGRELPAMRLGDGPKSPYRIRPRDLESYIDSRLLGKGFGQPPSRRLKRPALGSSASWADTYVTLG
jgi:excisionase family DNA binding protein